MKKISIVFTLMLGLTKLTAAEKAPITQFGSLISSITPKASLFNHQSFMNVSSNPLLPYCLRTPELLDALGKHTPQPVVQSLSYKFGRVALVTSVVGSAAFLAYQAYRYNFPASEAVHSPQVGKNLPITELKLTIAVQKNGWLVPLTFEINKENDTDSHAAFLAELQRDLTPAEKITTGENGAAANIPLLQENQTYTFTISGNVTYQDTKQYELQKEQVIDTQKGGRDPWIEAFWKKNIATRIASVWTELPGDLIDDSTATYDAVIFDTNTQEHLHSFSVDHKENFKEAVIEALASEIFATTVKQVEIKISVATKKDHFALTPLRLAINSPASNQAKALQYSFLTPTFKAAQRAYATHLWNEACERAFAEIRALEPLTTQEKVNTAIVRLGILSAGFFAIKKLEDENIPAACTVLGVATLTKMHNLYRAHKAAYH